MQVVRELFGLPAEEKVYDDFGCALSKKILLHGRLFCTEHYLCFYSNIMGFKTKIILALKDITFIQKKKSAWVIPNAIEIKTDKKDYFFGSFTHRNQAYQFISSLWKVQNPNRGSFEDYETEESDDEDEDAQLLNLKNEVFEDSKGDSKEDLNFSGQDDKNFQELFTKVVPMSISSFYDTFVADDAKFSIKAYFEACGEEEVELSNWEDSPDLGGFTRTLKLRKSLKGIPFGPDSTRVHKIQTYERSEKRLVLNGCSNSLDVPYGSYFQVEDRWEVLAIPDRPEHCLLTISYYVNFLKNTFLRSKIESSTMSECTKDCENWYGKVKERKMIPETEKKEKKDLIHLLEKVEEMTLKEDQAGSEFRKKWSLRRNMLLLIVFALIAVVLFLLMIIFYLNNHANTLDNRLQMLETLMVQTLNATEKAPEGSTVTSTPNPGTDL
eukprot:CAMPEP_0115014802 /NCGR_PEP_ID=MMETSP0216-20121206/26323_1 /TAXON_ID=223996 /ORGANISM="Protocruzia adherens, Strain Boccale" /LENGTH=438 /DNA_ID=CAMNT_0002384667 /DNA_START=1 /DNA_END=1317 /DNA_ORIENTATION=-